MIELRKYKHMHVYRVCARSSKCKCIYERGGWGAYLQDKTLHSNLAPKDGGGRLFEGGV